VLSERRDRNTFALRNLEDLIAFTYPEARYGKRLPIGTVETLNAATAAALKGFYAREYVPAHATLVVIGDFDAAAVEAAIRARFDSWQPAPAEPQPGAGPVDPKDKNRTDIFVDPALSERVTISRNAKWLGEKDSLAQRRENLLRQIGYAVVNRRLARQALVANPPFRAAALGTTDVFEAGRTTNLVVDAPDGKWQRGLATAAAEYRRALKFGFSQNEIAEQLAEIRATQRNAALGAATRSNGALYGAVSALIYDDVVPDTPENSLARLEAFVPQITPDRVLAGLKRELVPLEAPLIRFQGRRPVEGGAPALRAVWDKAMAAPLVRATEQAAGTFAYTDFGAPGTVVSDMLEPALGIRQIRFANGVRLNLKRTDLENDRVAVRMSIDGGQMLATRDDPLATKMVSVLGLAGLGKHSFDQIQTLTAGRTVGAQFGEGEDTFVASATTTPEDLELQLQLYAAYLSDPGYRPEAQTLYLHTINNFFASLRATPQAALGADLGRILSDGDPRFSLADVEEFRRLNLTRLKAAIGDRMSKGALEIGIVGDIEEDKAIALVARTLGALPAREPDFRAYTEQRQRSFTAKRGGVTTLYHSGGADQALVRVTWPTTDGNDPLVALRQQLLQRVLRIALTDSLREKLGKAYSPGVAGEVSRTYPGYGTLYAEAGVDPADVNAARAAIADAVKDVRDAPVPADLLLRARAPLLDSFDNTLKSNGGWMAYAAQAQSHPERIERYAKAKERLAAITPAQLQALARQYLTDNNAVTVVVLPQVRPAAATP
jgi:zinc protease